MNTAHITTNIVARTSTFQWTIAGVTRQLDYANGLIAFQPVESPVQVALDDFGGTWVMINTGVLLGGPAGTVWAWRRTA